MPLVQDELRRVAKAHLRRERSGHTLQPTALVNEVYLKLVVQRQTEWPSRGQFLAFASHLMRRILVDYGRRRKRQRRGGDLVRVTLNEIAGKLETRDISTLDLDRALCRLEELDARKVRIAELRFFGGLTVKEIAEVLDISERTVKRQWRVARLFLLREMTAP